MFKAKSFFTFSLSLNCFSYWMYMVMCLSYRCLSLSSLHVVYLSSVFLFGSVGIFMCRVRLLQCGGPLSARPVPPPFYLNSKLLTTITLTLPHASNLDPLHIYSFYIVFLPYIRIREDVLPSPELACRDPPSHALPPRELTLELQKRKKKEDKTSQSLAPDRVCSEAP